MESLADETDDSRYYFHGILEQFLILIDNAIFTKFLPKFSPNRSPSPPTGVQSVLSIVLMMAGTSASLLPFLPYESVRVFKERPSSFHGFVICLMLAFSGAFSGLMVIPKRPQLARIFAYYSVIFMAFAVSWVLLAFMAAIFKGDFNQFISY